MHNATVKIVFFVLLAIITANAQIKFKPPKIKKQADTTQVQQQKQSSPVNPAVVPSVKADSSVDALKLRTLSTADSISLPVPDSIKIPLIDFNNQSIQDVLKLLSAPYNINMAVDPGLKAKVTLRLTN